MDVNRTFFGVAGTDWFFAFQIAMAYIFAIPQLFRMFEDVRGVTITWLLFALIFVVLNLELAWSTHHKAQTRATFQTLCIYGNWVLLLGPMVAIAFAKCVWTRQDSVVSSFIGVAAIAVMLWGRVTKRGAADPFLRGLLVGLFRVVPHLYLVGCIVYAGSASGIPLKTIVAANITATARIITLVLSGRESGWGKGMKASLVSEIANEGSWLLVTATWLMYTAQAFA